MIEVSSSGLGSGRLGNRSQKDEGFVLPEHKVGENSY